MTEQNNDPSPQAEDANGSARKTYATPKLHVFGDVAALTRAVANTTTNADGGHGSMSKTH